MWFTVRGCFWRNWEARLPRGHPSVTDPAEPNPVDYPPLPSENLASPVPSEYLNWKINCDDHSSLSSTTAREDMNYFI